MEPSESLPTLAEPPGLPGELVVRNGRLSGTRRALGTPLTLIGQAAGCDVRLTADGVSPLHCIILDDAHGPILRDLGTIAGTKVNGHLIETCRLNNGDVLDIGPFQFSIALAAPRTFEFPGSVIALEGQYEALRIQAAAVAAQQSALLEEEGRLDQKGTALERQETQLASHLAQRQQQLDQAEEQLRRERTAFQEEHTARRTGLERWRNELEQALAAAESDRQKAAKERLRLVELRRRLKKRWHRHWDEQEASLKKREQAVQLAQKRLENERAKVTAFQERTNGELELGRRQLREEWQQLGLAQQKLDETINQEASERRRLQQALEARQAGVEAAEKTLAGKERRWQLQHAGMIKETEGLEARIRNQRATLEALERETARHQGSLAGPLPVSLVSVSPSPVSLAAPAVSVIQAEPLPADLRDLAGMLSDQRLHLTEQWQRLLQVQESWHTEREEALAELEETARRLAQRESEVSGSQRVVEAARDENERRREGLLRLRETLEGWQTRLTIHESDRRSQHEALLNELASRERLLQTRTQQLEEVHQRRNRRRQQEVVEYQAARARCDEARRLYSALWQECERLRETLGQQERSLSNRALALERYRQETIAQAPDSARAESRLDRLYRRDAARQEAEERDLKAERHKLDQQRKRLDEQSARLSELEEELLRRQRDYAARVGEWESQRAVAEEEDRRRDQEVRRLRALHALSERQLRELREELERIAGVMIDEAASASSTARQAA